MPMPSSAGSTNAHSVPRILKLEYRTYVGIMVI